MRFSRCQGVMVQTAGAVLALCVTTASVAMAKPKPGRPNSFRLFAEAAQLIYTANRVQCRVFVTGQTCATGSSTVGGGIWPRGTPDQYIFGSGINFAGVVDNALPKSENGFSGDTAGAFYNNTSTGSSDAEAIPVSGPPGIFSSSNANDVAIWPEAARVPQGDASADLFDPNLQGKIAASQGDLWQLNWEGNPARVGDRLHPLGIAIETRTLGWNFPSGNQDIIYFIYTFYNITSTNPADYAAIRPSLRPLLLQKGADFQALNTAKFGITLPANGYTIKNLFTAFVADMDVAQADINYAGVNVPFSLGYTYEHTFSLASAFGWTFDPAVFGSAPFFPGVGFVGVKFLGSPLNPATNEPVGLSLFGTFSRSSGSLQDPNDDRQLYRYITGGLLPTDGACSLPNPIQAKICFVNISSPADMRFFQSTGPLDLAPGASGTIVLAYIFAAPVADGNCPSATCDVRPANNNADLTINGDPVRMDAGVNQIDKIAGYLGNNNADPTRIPPDPDPTVVTQDEYITVPGSLLGKAKVAQTVFDTKFLLPFAPERPEFFLVPGNNQVTILWARSNTETVPDPFFAIASQPLLNGAPNALYDPNFRGTDVEGYRIYRGRVDNPSELQLIQQYDFTPSSDGKGIFTDFRGTVSPTVKCAPELGVGIGTACGAMQAPPVPGAPFTGSVDVDLVGTVTQVVPGNRVLLANGDAQLLPGALDTAFADVAAGRRAAGVTTLLTNSGVPFIFIDRGVRNSLRYFYTVTAFDVNSLSSGPSSIESARITKPVIPVSAPSNQQVSANLVAHTIGRDNVAVDTMITAPPTFDGATGKFSGPAQPADGGVIGFVGEFASSVIQPSQAGALTMRLDSLHMGLYSGLGAVFGVVTGGAVPTNYYVTVANGVDSFKVTVPFQQSLYAGAGAAGAPKTGTEQGVAFFEGLTIDPGTAQKFQGSPPFKLQGQATVIAGPGQELGGWGDGCKFGDFGTTTTCQFNGSRWFDGPSPTTNETADNPNQNCVGAAGASTAPLTAVECGANLANFNNAGALTGVTTIFQAQAYIAMNGAWRNLEWLLPTVKRAADFNVYWGDGGLVDSVIDVTHNVVVPFESYMGGGWGILNTSAGVAGQPDTRPGVGTVSDIGCVEPFFSPSGIQAEAAQCIACTAAAATPLSNTAVLGPVAFSRNLAAQATAPAAADPGFLFYLAGDVFLMTMPALPAKPAVWALRSYSGTIVGAPGAYTFTPGTVRPFTAIGATQSLEFGVSSAIAAVTKNDLSRVHTVPDPYYVKSKYEASTDQKILKFVGLPQDAIIRIYSASGVLVRMLEHHGGQYSPASLSQGSEMDWDLRNRNNQVVASGVYFYHVEAGDARRVGRFTVVNFAQ